MTMAEGQQKRLMELLKKLADRDSGAAIPDMTATISFRMPEFNGQEHNDAKTLVFMGWIHSQRFGDVMSSWSAEGIYAFDLTDDGKEALSAWNSSRHDGLESPDSGNYPRQQSRPQVMVIHGSSDGRVPQIVDDIRLWCFDNGLDAYKAADLPNSGRFVNVKVNDGIDRADYYIVVLTADEELKRGTLRPRPNTMIEMGRVLERNPSLVCVLKEEGVEMPSDYTGLITEPLDKWESVLLRELKEAGLL